MGIFSRLFPGIEAPILRGADKGDTTSEINGGKKVESVSKKIVVEVLDEAPAEKTLGSPEYMQPKLETEVVVESAAPEAPVVAPKKAEVSLSDYGQVVLGELIMALDGKGITGEKKQEFVDQFAAKVDGKTENIEIDKALSDILFEAVALTSEQIQKREIVEEKTVVQEKDVEAELKKGLEVIEKESDKAQQDGSKEIPFNAEVVEAEKPEEKAEEFKLSFSEFNKQRKAFWEKFEELSLDIIKDDVQRGEIVFRIGETLEIMRRDKRNIHVESAKKTDVWNAIFDEVLKQAGVKQEGDMNILRDRMIESLQDDTGEVAQEGVQPVDELSAEEELTEIEKSDFELENKLNKAVIDGKVFYDAYEEKIEVIFNKSGFAGDKKKAEMVSEKLASILEAWKNFVERYEADVETVPRLLTEFELLKGTADALMREVVSLKVVAHKKERKDERGENSFERVTKLIEDTKKARIEKIKHGEKGVALLMITEISVSGLPEEENKRIVAQIDAANDEILKAKKEFLEKSKHPAKRVEPSIEKSVEIEKKIEQKEDDVWTKELKRALENIKMMTVAQFDKEYKASQIMYADSDYNAHKVLSEFLHTHEHDSVDAHHAKEKKAFAVVLEAARHINEGSDLFDVIIVNGHTYKVKKNIESADTKKDEKEDDEKATAAVKHPKKKIVIKKAVVKKVAAEKAEEIKNTEKVQETERKERKKLKEIKLPHVWDSLQEHPENFEMVLNELKRVYQGIVDAMNESDEMKKAPKDEWQRILRANTDLAIDWVVEKHSLTNDEKEKADLREHFFKKIHKH